MSKTEKTKLSSRPTPSSADEMIETQGKKRIHPGMLKGKGLEEWNSIKSAYREGKLKTYWTLEVARHAKRICGLTCTARTIERHLQGEYGSDE